jgi:PDZ domain-containing protein
MPGPTFNTFGKNQNGQNFIQIANTKTNFNTPENNGQLRFVTVSVLGSHRNLPLIFPIVYYFLKSSRVLPSAAILDSNLTNDQQDKVFQEQMTQSSNTSIQAAQKYLKLKKMPKITFNTDNIGGPSAGLMFTLNIISQIQNNNLSGNKIIGGTGTISNNGQVGEIGGIRQKIISAQKDNAKYFLTPVKNCAELNGGWTPNGIQVVKVATLTDAVNALKLIRDNKPLGSEYKCF